MRSRFAVWMAVALAASCTAAVPARGEDTSPVAPAARPDSTGASAAIDTAAATQALTPVPPSGPPTAPPEDSGVAPAPAPVFLGGKELFRVLSTRDGIDPAQRAALIRKRLDAAVADVSVPVDSLRLVPTKQGVEFRMGPYFLGVVTPGDVRGIEPPLLVSRMAGLLEQIREGITRERADRKPTHVLISAALVILFTLIAWILVRLVLRAGRWWRGWLARQATAKLPSLRVGGGFELLTQAQMMRVLAVALGWLEIPVILVIADLYVTLVLARFPWTQSWGWRLQQFTLQALVAGLVSIGSALPGLVAIVAIVILFRWLMRLSDRFFQEVEQGTVKIAGLHPDLARPTRRLVNIGLWVVAAAVAFPFIPGSSSKAFQGMSVLIGIAVSLGSTSIIGNIIAGIALTYSRAFKVGDLIKVGEHLGVVQSLGTLATKLRNIRNEEITIPNGQLAGSSIENFTRLAQDPGLVLHTQVTIGYDAEWRKVHALLIEAALRVENIERDPAPWVYQRSLNDSHITYELCCLTRNPIRLLKLYSDLHEQIQDAFNRAGVEILSPAYHAMRDANAPVLPAEPAGPRPAPGGFRVRPGG